LFDIKYELSKMWWRMYYYSVIYSLGLEINLFLYWKRYDHPKKLYIILDVNMIVLNINIYNKR